MELSPGSSGEGVEYEDGATPRLQERTARNLQEQDQQLDQIHAGVVRLKHQAAAANDEVQAQNAMLDHIAVNVSGAEEEVVTQTQRARKVNRMHRDLCVYYILIVLLAIALIVILII